MAKKDVNNLFDKIILEIAEDGKSLRDAVKGKMSINTFYDFLKDDNCLKRYVRACEDRADKIADEIIEISDNIGGDMKTMPDGREVVDNAVVQRDRLRVDSRKWLLAKLHPKKYGEKLDVTSGNAPLLPPAITFTNFKDSEHE